MSLIKALLVGVSEYPTLGLDPLPLCKNDLYAMQSALISGLNIDKKDILLCGETGFVTSTDLILSINSILSDATTDDTVIFYFTGHGGKNCLALSDNLIDLQNLIDTIEQVHTKNKIVILDSCHSGGFSVNDVSQMDIAETVESFVGYGYAVLASCGAEQVSGFNKDREISLYTSFVCDALTARFLIRKGKKSLEIINEAIFHFADMFNRRGLSNFQQPIFRSSIGGTIFFDVEEYTPYKVKRIYEETDNYIIYDVEPLHQGMVKRLSVKVILRYKSTLEQIAELATEIQKKVLCYEVHQNEIAESHHKGNYANIVWCYFGYDEDDMIDRNFICHTTWVDNTQDKNWWYCDSKNATIVNGVYIDIHTAYKMIKSLKHSNVSIDEFISQMRECTTKIISIAERYIKEYREFINTTMSEEQLIESVSSLNNEISILFIKQNDLPIPPNELHEWAKVQTQIACTIHDFSLFYNKEYLNAWQPENRKWLMSNAIKRYEVELENLKRIEQIITDKSLS